MQFSADPLPRTILTAGLFQNQKFGEACYLPRGRFRLHRSDAYATKAPPKLGASGCDNDPAAYQRGEALTAPLRLSPYKGATVETHGQINYRVGFWLRAVLSTNDRSRSSIIFRSVISTKVITTPSILSSTVR
jgi:hypothetical protein